MLRLNNIAEFKDLQHRMKTPSGRPITSSVPAYNQESKVSVYDINPVPKPRMTRSDKWNKRKCVVQYRDYCDQVRAAGIIIPESGSTITFMIPMPESWTAKKKKEMLGAPHQTKPDKDNLEKALLDACYKSDAHIWDSRVIKRWGYTGQIIIKSYNNKVF